MKNAGDLSDKPQPEITLKACLLSIILAVILAAANAYLGLKIGIIVSASIPAAIIAMVVLRMYGPLNILEVNIVQTGASASASIVVSLVFILPALLIIGYWTDMHYWQTVVIMLIGGILGILLSIPMRRTLLNHPELKFPEGVAIASVLKATQQKSSIKELGFGGLVGALFQFCQQGSEIFAYAWHLWFSTPAIIVGGTVGFDATMFGAGYIIGAEVGASLLVGAIIGWMVGIPVLSSMFSSAGDTLPAQVMSLWTDHLRYIGVGALLTGGMWSLLLCLKPIMVALRYSFEALTSSKAMAEVPRIERDLPGRVLVVGISLLAVMSVFYILIDFDLQALGFSYLAIAVFLVSSVCYILFAGFIFSAICAYFSGLVGVTASPISSMNIGIVILFSLLMLCFINEAVLSVHASQVLHVAGLVIIVTGIVGCAASMANGNIQDLKTGQLVGSTPWKLQVMLIVGVIVSALVGPPIVSMLYYAYGIDGALPSTLHDPSQSLPAPQATIIATISQGIFLHNLPFVMIGVGVAIALCLIVLRWQFKKTLHWFSLVGFCLGVYLPMSVTIPLALGGIISGVALWRKRQKHSHAERSETDKGMLIATGLIAGGSLMGVFLAVPFSITGNPDLLSIVSPAFAPYTIVLSVAASALILLWLYKASLQSLD